MAGPSTGGLSDIRRALLDAKAQHLQVEAAQRDRMAPVPRGGRLAVAEQQRYLWFLHRLAPQSPTYNEPFTIRLRGDIDLDALRAALLVLVKRHECLRTRFGDEHGVPYQVIDPAPDEWPLPVADGAEETMQAWIDGEAAAPFDLYDGPVFRSSVLRIAPDDHVLMLVWHLIVSDTWSARLISDELAAIYSAARNGSAPVSLPALDLQQADFAAWQRRWLVGEEMSRQVDFWHEALAGIEPLDFPADHPRPPVPTGAGAIHQSEFPPELCRGLREFAAAEGVSLFSVLLAGFETVLYRYTGQQDLAFGTLLPGRSRPQVESMVGTFANAVVFRGDFTGNPNFRTLIQRCDATLLNAVAHQDAPFGALVEAIKPDREPGRSPLFQHVFSFLPAATAPTFDLAGVESESLSPTLGTSRFDLSIQVTEKPDGELAVWVEFSTELFARDRIERLAGHLTTVLAAALADPDGRADSLELLSPVERALVLDGWNPVPVVRPEGLLHELVARQAEAGPERTAMRFLGKNLTYRDLDSRANRLAHLLIDEHHAGPGQIVGVLLERGLDLPVAELAVLKTGAAWLPLDPQYPPDRLAYQLTDAQATALITTSDLAPNAPADLPRVLLDTAPLDHHAGTPPQVRIVPEDAAYVIYTSGSTGRPKGVMVPHRAATHFCHNLAELFGLGPGDRVLQLANPAFDVSVSDIFATLAAGATIIGAPRTTLFNPDTLQTLLAEEKVTFGDIPPAVLRLLDPQPLTDIRILFIGMEPFGPELVNTWAKPGRQFHNGYGPTEVTITCVDYHCPDTPLTEPPPIGRAMANHRAYILDHNLQPTPVGIPGQLYMAGAGLAHGYLGRTDHTADTFLPDPHTTQPGQRMYATGDMATWRPDGNIQFLGRIDRQVKIHGLRIELGEIEHAIGSHPDVQQAAVIAQDPGTAQARLIGYAVPHPGATLDTDALRSHLADRLPLHMIPATIIGIPKLPLTNSGKLDAARLPLPEANRPAQSAPPQTDTQRRLADVWHKLLSIAAAGISTQDDFFALGGNSLQVIQLISRIRDEFETTLEPRQLFTHPRLDQLAAQIDAARAAAQDAEDDARLEAEIAELSEEELDRLLAQAAADQPEPTGTEGSAER
jgi:amino acid adenylation domain-containing protein